MTRPLFSSFRATVDYRRRRGGRRRRVRLLRCFARSRASRLRIDDEFPRARYALR